MNWERALQRFHATSLAAGLSIGAGIYADTHYSADHASWLLNGMLTVVLGMFLWALLWGVGDWLASRYAVRIERKDGGR